MIRETKSEKIAILEKDFVKVFFLKDEDITVKEIREITGYDNIKIIRRHEWRGLSENFR